MPSDKKYKSEEGWSAYWNDYLKRWDFRRQKYEHNGIPILEDTAAPEGRICGVNSELRAEQIQAYMDGVTGVSMPSDNVLKLKICSECRNVLADCVTTEPSMHSPEGEVCPLCGVVSPGLYFLRIDYLKQAIRKINSLEDNAI